MLLTGTRQGSRYTITRHRLMSPREHFLVDRDRGWTEDEADSDGKANAEQTAPEAPD